MLSSIVENRRDDSTSDQRVFLDITLEFPLTKEGISELRTKTEELSLAARGWSRGAIFFLKFVPKRAFEPEELSLIHGVILAVLQERFGRNVWCLFDSGPCVQANS